MKPFVKYFFIVGLLIIGWAIPSKAFAAARLYMSPSSSSVKVGDTVTSSVFVDSGGQSINAAEGTVSYPSDLLEYRSISTSGSIFTFWTNGPSANASTATFGGGLSQPGYTGSAGRIMTITWRAKANGTATISLSGGKVLANDGQGSNIFGSASGATISIGVAPTPKPTPTPVAGMSVRSSSHPDQNKWYNNRTVTVNWSSNVAASGYAIAFDQNAGTDPGGDLVQNLTRSYENVADGTWYFHAKAKIATGFTPVVHYKVLVDTTAPKEFTVTINQEKGLTNPTPQVSFSADDDGSGIAGYQASINGGAFFEIKSGAALAKQLPGSHTIIVRAIDRAGNSRDSSATYRIQGIDAVIIESWTKSVALLKHISFTGKSLPDDTITIYLGDKIIAEFVAKDFKIEATKQGRIKRATAQSPDGTEETITWEYVYKEPVFPGSYSFRFTRTDITGAQSEITQPYYVAVMADSVWLGDKAYSTKHVMVALGVVVALLLLIIIGLLFRIRYITHHMVTGVKSVNKKIAPLLTRTEKAILHDIDETIPNYELSKGSVVDAKKTLHKKVHETIEDEKSKVKE